MLLLEIEAKAETFWNVNKQDKQTNSVSAPNNWFWLLTQQKSRNEICTFCDSLHESCCNGALLMHLSAAIPGNLCAFT